MTKRFDVFLSHNSRDKSAVRELAEALRGRGLRVWLDEWELVPGRPWQEALEEIIETTRSSAVLVGKDGLGPWQDAEMRGCLFEFVDRKLPVIPVLLPGAPEAPKLPLFLKRFTWVDLRGGMTEEGIDLLQWGAIGKRPDRPKLPSAPTAVQEASVAAAAAQPQPAGRYEVRPQEPLLSKAWVALVIGGVLLAILLGLALYREAFPSPATEPITRNTPIVRASPLTFQDLMEYIYEETPTDIQREEFLERHLGRRVTWDGWVGSVSDRQREGISVLLTLDKRSAHYLAFLRFPQEDRAQLVSLSFGQRLSATCTFVDFDARAHLTDCELVKVWPVEEASDNKQE